MSDRRPPPPHEPGPPTLLVVLLLVLSLMAVWFGSIVGAAAWWVALLASLGIVAGAWLAGTSLERQARSRTRAEQALERLAASAGAEADTPEEVAEAVGAALSDERERVRALLAVMNSIDEPLIACNAAGEIVAANRAARSLLAPGSSRMVLGEPLGQLLTDARALAAVTEAGRGEPARAQARLLTGAGPRIVEVAAEPVAGGPFETEDPPAVVVSLRDVTEQATALQLKTDFVANASHELRTPLASIRTAAETLTSLGDEGGAMRSRLVAMIASNAERLEELARDLLDLSRLESPEAECVIERVDLREVAESLGELFAPPCAQRRVGLEFDLDPQLARAWTDPKLVRLVLRNLIDNAIKFAYEDTVVRVRGRVVRPKSSGGEDRLTARLQVIDRGIGIPLSQQQRVFERFFQVDEARTGSQRRRGTGLGLAIVKHALRALGGTIKVESVWQQGTTMTVDLPGCVEAPEATATPAQAAT